MIEYGGLSDPRFRLSYYDYDNVKEDSKPKVQWSAKEGDWSTDCHVQRMNTHSKVGWWSYKHGPEITFKYFDLLDHPEGQISVVTTKNTLNNDYGINNISLGISDLWEIKPNVYMLAAFSNKFEHGDKCKKNGIINDNYVIDASILKEEASLRETKFVFDVETDGFPYNNQVIDSFGISGLSIYHTFRHKEGKLQTTPVYYVNNETEEIIYKSEWRSICHASHFFFPAWDAGCVVQATHDNGDCKEIKISVQKVLNNKEMFLHFLLHLNEDFDDDLLQDAVELVI